ncbi:MAG TPA: hypothetical protein VGM05_27390 [Planctomycetaceae bacterium]
MATSSPPNQLAGAAGAVCFPNDILSPTCAIDPPPSQANTADGYQLYRWDGS